MNDECYRPGEAFPVLPGKSRKAGIAYGRSCGAAHCQRRRSERNPMREYPGPCSYEKRNESAKERCEPDRAYRKVRQRTFTSDEPGADSPEARVSRGR